MPIAFTPGKLIAALLAACLLVAAPTATAKPKKGKAKLAITEASLTRESVEPGAEFKVKGKIENRGKRAFTGKRRITVEMRQGGKKTRVGSAAVPKLGPGKEKRFGAEASAPA